MCGGDFKFIVEFHPDGEQKQLWLEIMKDIENSKVAKWDCDKSEKLCKRVIRGIERYGLIDWRTNLVNKGAVTDCWVKF